MTLPLVVGNWKMHGTQSECRDLARNIARRLDRKAAAVEVALAPPFTALSTVAKAIDKSKIALAAQNCHWQTSGAFTGEISPPMLAEFGCQFVILGHSERRHVFHEDDEMISRKLAPVITHGMHAILCVGETLEERQKELTDEVILRQLRVALKDIDGNAMNKLEIAYEPVWAIGTGQNATAQQVRTVHTTIQGFLKNAFENGSRVRVLYGGSVKPENAEMFASIDEVDGLLVGGASLQSDLFLPIVSAFANK